MKPSVVLLAAAVLLSGCAQYTYFGRMQAKDSADKDREFVVYWTKTERKLWFDTAAGGVRLLTECSTNVVDYEEKPQGIVFLRRPSDVGVGETIALGEPCGSIVGGKHVADLTDGPLELTVHCRPDTTDDFAVSGVREYLRAREAPYQFDIQKKRTSDVSGGAPEPQQCRR
jgi:hypothetical protein